MNEVLRQTIRGILIEELAAQGVDVNGGPQVREESVAINSDADLAGFVDRVLTMTRDARVRREIESGRYVFRLAAAVTGGGPARAGTGAGEIRIERGLVTEKQINQLPDHVKLVRVGKSVRFTPLAQDALRLGGINIERSKT